MAIKDSLAGRLVFVGLFVSAATLLAAEYWLDFFDYENGLVDKHVSGKFVTCTFAILLVFYLYLQMTSKTLITGFGYLIVTFLFIPVFIVSYAHIYRDLEMCPTAADSVTCIYFSAVTFTTLGYGDVQPAESARLVAASEALFGFVIVPVLISQFVALVQKYNSRLSISKGLTKYQEN